MSEERASPATHSGGFALVWTLVMRPFGGEIAARRLLLAGWKDLADLAAGERARDQRRLAGLMLDRLGQIIPRLASVEDRELSRIDGYAEIRLGLNIVELQRMRRRLTIEERMAVDRALTGIAALFETRFRQRTALDASPRLLAHIDSALATLCGRMAMPARRSMDALVGVRRALFLDASAPNLPLPAQTIPIAAE